MRDLRTRLLDAIAGPESRGLYDIRYTPKGGATFTGYDAHPRIFEPGPAGPSSAAGRYQITASTYDRLGGGPFTPQAQDDMAFRLATMDYKSRTGRDLMEDLGSEGLSPRIITALAPTWPGLKDNTAVALRAWENGIGSGPVAQAASPAPAGTAAATQSAAAPVYANDWSTLFRRAGNAIAPDLVDAPTPLTTEQAAVQKQELADAAALGSASKGFLALANLAAPKQEREEPMLPPIRFAQNRPVRLPRPRGLL